MRYLLDKNSIRSALSGLHFGQRRALAPAEIAALEFWRAAELHQPPLQLFIPYTSAHVLSSYADYASVRLLAQATTILYPGPYTRRWRRRLQETTGLTAEDAMILALGTFGTNSDGIILGTHAIVTADKPMLNGYLQHQPKLRQRLEAMTRQLASPFNQVSLPEVITPETFIAEQA
jgi:hypothetical protein